jgi:hypothetical protein
LDVDNIAPGLNFVSELNERVAECDVLLAVIGKGWIDARDAAGNRRLDDPDDFVRIEIASALNQGKRVIPVLVGEAHMPRPDQLPEAIRPLASRNAVRLTHERFGADIQGLIGALQPKRNAFRPAMVILTTLAVVLLAGVALFWIKNTTPSSNPQATAIATPQAASPSLPPPAAQSINGALPETRTAPVQSPDEIAWILLKDTTDTAALRRFTEQFPDSPLRKDAQARISALAVAPAAKADAAAETGTAGALEDATTVSASIMGPGTIPAGKTVILTAPNGRKMACIGGNQSAHIQRKCTWR